MEAENNEEVAMAIVTTTLNPQEEMARLNRENEGLRAELVVERGKNWELARTLSWTQTFYTTVISFCLNSIGALLIYCAIRK